MTYTPRGLLSPGLLVTITILPSTALAQRPVGEREVAAVVDSFHMAMGRGRARPFWRSWRPMR